MYNVMLWFVRTRIVALLNWKHKNACYRITSLTNFIAQFFIHQQYVCYTTFLDMFRALTCPSSGGQIV